MRLIADTVFPGILLFEERLLVIGPVRRDLSVLLIKAPAPDMLPGIFEVIGISALNAHRVNCNFADGTMTWELILPCLPPRSDETSKQGGEPDRYPGLLKPLSEAWEASKVLVPFSGLLPEEQPGLQDLPRYSKYSIWGILAYRK